MDVPDANRHILNQSRCLSTGENLSANVGNDRMDVDVFLPWSGSNKNQIKWLTMKMMTKGRKRKRQVRTILWW